MLNEKLRDTRMRVLQLLSSAGFYGAENMLLNLCVSQKSAGVDTTLLVFYNAHQPNLELYEEAKRRGLNPSMVRCEGRIDWKALREIRSQIRERAIDVVHAHGYKADLYAYIAARRERKPVVATCHNWREVGSALRVYNRLDRMALKRFDAIAAVSDAVAGKLRLAGVPAGRIRTVPNGIDARAFEEAAAGGPAAGSSLNSPVIGVVGRLDLQKGFEHLFEAVRGLRESHRGLKVVIVGEGPDRAEIEAMVRKLGLEDQVTLVGQRSDMPAVYAGMDIFVLPSLNEGLPMTVLEAMAASRPVVATRVGAIPKVVEDGQTGLLVEPGDVFGLRGAIYRLLSNPDLRRRLGQQARARVLQHYTSDIMALRYAELYQQVLAQRATVAAGAGTFEVGKARGN
jgi:glycosyltransferase involved in cell wall biosynthesis